ncbi:putative cell wall-binding protein [Clostridium algifaecis]|uniref:Cell wall-binding protein n=1 Tax=Clostridium algifaecis TaxID=1472040 RepID=A0ABS4KRI8_9CLOT|nr:cell wall-binding repeat-containing protein [Clostridium algifaecis]MBP2032225.1 putative cell wall-binding protein [Clostridium algifaecis]
MQKRNKKILSVCSLASLVISSSVVSTGVKAASSQPSSTRISGADRYETAVQVSKTGWTSSDYVVIANGQGYADALCADPLAKAKNAPVLLTQSDSLSSSTIAEIKRLNAKHVIIVGGTGVVKSNIEDTIKSQTGADITRYGGTDRYETSTKIAAAIGTTSKVVLASGQGFADALSAAPAASIEGVPIILTQANSLPQTSANYIKANSGITKTYVIGGTASVSDSVLSQVPGGQRFGGSDRFATNKAVIEGLSSDFNFNNVYVALGVGPNGNEFADALTGAALAGKNKNALVITSNPLSSYTTQLLSDKLTTSSTITVLGGTANISDSILSQLKSAVTNTGSTSGGGGSSTGETKNITSQALSSNFYTTLGKNKQYYTVASGANNDSIDVTLKNTSANDKVDTLEGIFANAKTRYGYVDTTGKLTYVDTPNAEGISLKNDVGRVNARIDMLDNNFKMNGVTGGLKAILGSLGSKYFTPEGYLDYTAIEKEIEANPNDAIGSYSAFYNDLNGQKDSYFNNNKTLATSTPTLTCTIGDYSENVSGLSFTNASNSTTTLYSKNNTVEVNVNALVENLFPAPTTAADTPTDSISAVGTYKVTFDNRDYIVVNVK